MRKQIGEGMFLLAEGEDLRTYGKTVMGDDLLQRPVRRVIPHAFSGAWAHVIRELVGPMGRVIK